MEQVSDNRLFAMFHSCTDEHNKRVVMSSLSQADGVVRVVFATMALGMGVDFKSLDYVIHYGAPRSLEDYMQESGRAGLTIRINSAPFVCEYTEICVFYMCYDCTCAYFD